MQCLSLIFLQNPKMDIFRKKKDSFCIFFCEWIDLYMFILSAISPLLL